MKNGLRCVILAVFMGGLLLCLAASAQMNILWSYANPSTTHPLQFFCGAANMDADAADELVYYSLEHRLLIFDGATGNVDWDSGVWLWLRIGGAQSEARLFGYSPLCDINGDGRSEISFEGKEFQGDSWKVYVVGDAGGSAVSPGTLGILSSYPVLTQNYPNPFNPLTTINYELQASNHVTLDVFNLSGQRVRTLVNEQKSKGAHTVLWDGKDDAGNPLASGAYYYQLRAGNHVLAKTSILVK